MTELEDLKTQLKRAQAMLMAHQHLLAALSAHSGISEDIIKTFHDLSSRDQDLQYFELISDSEINDVQIAHNLLLDYITRTSSWLNSKS